MTTGTRRGRRPGVRLRSALAGLLVAGALLVALGWPSSVGAASGATIGTATSAKFGTVLVDAQGFALYTFSGDHGGISSCNSGCLTIWPALTVPSGTTPTSGPGVSGTVAAMAQPSGVDQVTYNGSPLYTFVSDTAPGQVNGNGVGGFSVVQVAAAPPTPSTTPSPPSTTPSPPTTPAPTGTPAPTDAPSPSPMPATSPGSPSAPTAPAAAASSPAPASTGSASAGGAAPPAPSAPAQAPASSVGPATPGTLAFTGPGPSLKWIALAGAVLIVVSLAVLAIVGEGERRCRRTIRRMIRAGGVPV